MEHFFLTSNVIFYLDHLLLRGQEGSQGGQADQERGAHGQHWQPVHRYTAE